MFADTQQVLHVLALHNSFSFHLILICYTIFWSGSKYKNNRHVFSLIQSCKNFRFPCCFYNGWLYLPSVKATEILNLSCWLEILDLPLLSITSDIFADTKLVHVLALHNSFSFLLSLVWQTTFYLAVMYGITFHHHIMLGHD